MANTKNDLQRIIDWLFDRFRESRIVMITENYIAFSDP